LLHRRNASHQKYKLAVMEFAQGVSGWACPWSSPVSGSSKGSLFSKKYKAKRHGASFYTVLF
jgi:hypothetical protein